MIFKPTTNNSLTNFDNDYREQRRLVFEIGALKNDHILCDLETIMLLYMSDSYTPSPITRQTDILDYSKGKFIDVGKIFNKTIYQDYSGKLEKYEYLGFDSIEAINNKILYNNRLEKLERILEDDDEKDGETIS